MFHPTLIELATKKILNCQNGFLLSAALTLLTALILLGTTAFILSSTDIKIGGNFRNNQMVLQVAMAGAERAREALRVENLASSNTASFSDELNSAARKGANGALDGYSATTDDVPLATGTLNNVTYNAYLSNDSVDGTTNTTDSNGRVMITSVATGPNNAKAQVQIVVTLQPPPSSPATIYSKGDVTGNGSSLTVSGNDACGAGTALAPIYTKDPATTSLNGSPTLTGSPSTPQHGTLDIDIPAYIDALKAGATTTLTADQNGATYGSATNYQTVYSWPDDPAHFNNQGLKLQNVTGYGVLLVKGDLELGGGFQWNGVIIVTGSVTLNGGGGSAINIYGQIFSGTSTLTDVTINGGNTIGYDSCKVKKAMAGSPLKVMNWRQNYN
jgi:Tfp pilus assembly protein PilX